MNTKRDEHGEIVARLSDYMAGELEPEASAEIEVHLSECGGCRRALEELRAVVAAVGTLGALDPPRDLWPGIAATIDAPAPRARAETKVIEFPGAAAGRSVDEELSEAEARGVRRLVFTVPQLAAASVALVAASAFATWAMSGGVAAPSTAGPDGSVSGAVVFASTAADVGPPPAELADELAALEQTLAAARAELDPNTVRVLERSLAVIEQAIADSRLAIEQDPGNEFLAAHLERVYERKLLYLREAVRVAEWSD